MKITFDREQMLAAFQTAAVVVPTRTTKPILKNVRIDVEGSTATLMATDLEVGIRIEISILECEAPGSMVAPVSLFGSILRENTDEKLRMETSSGGTVVRGDRSEFKLPHQNPDEFPQISPFSESVYHTLPVRVFREIIRRTTFATDTENSRYALGGVLLEMEDQKIIGVATDGRRLAKMEGAATTVGGHNPAQAMTIVPTRAMQLIERALGSDEGEVQLATRQNDILVRGANMTVLSRLVEGRFPRWRDVLPVRSDSVRIELPVGPLYAKVREAAIFTNAESRGIDFRFGDGYLHLQASVAESGQSHVELPVSYSGGEISLAMDNRYLLDFLRVLDPQKSVTVDVVDSESAALFTTDDGYSYVLMPMARDS